MPSRWRSYFIYLLQTLLNRLDGSTWSPQQHEVEQLMYRYTACRDCVIAGKCVYSDCGCKMPARAHVKTDMCPNSPPKWGPMMSKEAWDKEKEDKEIKFILLKKL